MPNLIGTTPADTYTFLLQVNGGVTGSLKTVEDGAGNDLPIKFSTASVSITGDTLIVAPSAVIAPLTLKGFPSHTANLQEWQSDVGFILASVAANGTFTAYQNIIADSGNLQANYISDRNNNVAYIQTSTDSTHAWTLFNGVANKVAFSIKGTTSQSANLFECKNVGGTVVASISPAGSIVLSGSLVVGSGASSDYYTDLTNTIAYFQTNTDSTHAWTLINQTASKVPLSVKAAASQTAPLQEWKNSGSTVLAKIDALGALTTVAVASPALIHTQFTTNTNNYSSASAWVNHVSTNANLEITGVVAGANGEMRRWVNVGSFNLVWKTQSTSSTAANRLEMPSDVTMSPGSWLETIYDTTIQRWRLV